MSQHRPVKHRSGRSVESLVEQTSHDLRPLMQSPDPPSTLGAYG
jgi:hypothetical protein